ncbi:MAG: hypothetical protein EBV10_12200, partial [Synechococcaceae bacterium WB6_1A_059]|nr:hypothetical protein [Synechococcaceae bacterium WB6_1A_059]
MSTNRNYSWTVLPNLGYIETLLSEQDLEPLLREIDLIEQGHVEPLEANGKLSGHIKKEYLLEQSRAHIESLTVPLGRQFFHEFNYWNNQKNQCGQEQDFDLVLDILWLNRQQQGEFNPPHNHSGALSFVIFVDVPYLIEHERNHAHERAQERKWGCFEFLYTDILGQLRGHLLEADESWRGRLIMFPALLCHTVYPFVT